ncbi:hypothetical protein CKM354_001251200 [Cercospora kikuchii]|uniref:Uncharacterized protein n=1 Tax=Cercospora kikuchii TaxID=84275 RepID=A0A9P3L2S2_9PEZI|nr:uncharacterized protein CKM354_001251200 [Cercospora kikuchii]GIZ49482.1 hypothetical protein CKM354_001251200 [Cercospora kikuchii]
MSHSWLTKTPQQLLNAHSKPQGTRYTDLATTLYIIDSKKLFLLRNGKGQYTPPTYHFSPPPFPQQESMEHYAFKLTQPFIESHLLHQIHFVDLAFDKPLIEQHPQTDPSTLHLSLIITAQNGCSITPSWIKQNMQPYQTFDFIDFSLLPTFLPSSTHLHTTQTALTRYKTLIPRLKNIHGAGVAETALFRTYLIRTLNSAILQHELLKRKTLAKGYICLFEEDGKLYLLPASQDEELGQKKTKLRSGEEWEVIGKWKRKDGREGFEVGDVRPGGDLLQVWWSCFYGRDGGMVVEVVEGIKGEEGGWDAVRWRDGSGAGDRDAVPRWVRENNERWVLQDVAGS